MIEIRHTDYSSINTGELFLEDDTKNIIYFENNCLWVTCKTFEKAFEKEDCESYKSSISFDITKEFIQELKALVMVMENTFEEIDDDSRY